MREKSLVNMIEAKLLLNGLIFLQNGETWVWLNMDCKKVKGLHDTNEMLYMI